MKYPNRIQAALLLDAHFDGLEAAMRDFARIAEMKSGATLKIPEEHPGVFYRLYGGGDELMLTFEYVDAAPSVELFASALASPVTSLMAPDMKERVERAGSHILLEASHGPLGAADGTLANAALLGDPALAPDHPVAFESRLEALALMARVVSDHVTPAAIHWTQSNQLFELDTFEALASGGSGP